MSCFCLSPYSATPDNSGCVLVLTANTMGSASTLISQKGATNEGIYGLMGTVFYEDITSLNFPIVSSGITNNTTTQNGTPLFSTTCWVDQNNRVLNYQLGGPGQGENILPGYINLPPTFFGPQIFPSLNDTSTVWGTSSTKGRLNYCGIWPTTTDPAPPIDTWIGFTACIDIPTTQTFYIGLGADNFFRLKLNGNTLLQTNLSPQTNGLAYSPIGMFTASWSVFPITLQSGPNYIELEGYNIGGPAVFGAEIYSGDVATLSAITSQAVLDTYTIFSTGNLIGQPFENAGTSGYSCENDFVLNSCNPLKYCVRVLRSPCASPPTTTTTTTQSYLNEGYIPVNDCSVFTVAPMIVNCNVTNVTGKEGYANGSITLGITGGTTPYSIIWEYPNGITIQGHQTIDNLSIGTYTATVRDYYGDFIVTTSCTVATPTTTTTTSTTTLPSPYELYSFCMTITVTTVDGSIVEQYQFNFIPNGDINGYPSWISDYPGEEIVYYNPSVPNNGGWSVSGSSISVFTLNNITVFNSNPSYPPIAGINQNFTGWTILYKVKANSSVTVTEGLCF
jgi:hypothetical protein